MTQLINSLKTFASSSSAVATTSIGNQFEHFHQPLMTLGRADSCTESGFNQWRDAMRMVARLPGGLPTEFRLRLWENLADRYLLEHGIEWSRIASKCLNGNSRDQEISDQIEKDLHRTGCTGFSCAKQAVLKTVLMAYSHWNPSVGYCQGFNMIGAMLLQMTNGNEKLTLKVLIFLIEGVLPEGYFGQGLRGLAVDMAVFREILKLRKPTLNAHLNRLQKRDNSPPLTDVFTMHWFLTLFIHCLPPQTVLRVWDLVLLEGSEILLRTSLVLLAAIETRLLCVTNTDEFYSVMGVVTREMLEFGLMDPNSLMKCVVSVGPFPFPGLAELRQRQRVLISQDTPCKSFFLAKRELDTLKRHYAAMKHRRQRTTTIIFKGLDLPLNKSQQQRSSLLVVPTKRQVSVSPKPKMRRQGSGKNNNCSSSSPMITNKNCANGKSGPINSINHSIGNGSRSKQITVSWDKSLKTKFRKRRSSASSHTSTSSSTELCDSSSEDNEDVGGRRSSSFQPSGKSGWVDPASKTAGGDLKINISNDDDDVGIGIGNSHACIESSMAQSSSSLTSTAAAAEGLDLGGLENNFETELDADLTRLTTTTDNNSESSEATTKCIDTNDSQHFLDEMSRLGKSDSFYENLSQRICELQFQNLTLLTTCNTTIDKENSLSVEQDYSTLSPLPSPISPIQPFYGHQDFSKLSLSPYLHHASLSPSPRGSISSNGESPLPRSPLSPSPDPNYSNLLSASLRKSSKSSVSSVEFSEEFKEVHGTDYENPSLLKSSGCVNNGTDYPLPVINFKSDSELDGTDGNEEFKFKSVEDGPKIDVEPISEAEINQPEASCSKEAVEPDYVFEPTTTTDQRSTSTSGGLLNEQPTTELTEPSQTGQSQSQRSEDDINAVIRENIAILQRLKMKPAYGDEAGDDFDYFDYFSTDSSEDDDDDGAFRKEKGPEASRNFASTSKPKTRSRSNSSSSKSGLKSGKTHKPKKQFNPFPTTRRPRLKTSKFGLYN